jgi:membrane protein
LTNISPKSPEERHKTLVLEEARGIHHEEPESPPSRAWEVTKRVAVGVYNDGFIHAGNLAYLSLVSLFPFFIVSAAIARVFGQTEGGMQTVTALLQTMPPDVAQLLRKPINDVLTARSGTLLWVGAVVGLWTTGSFIETIRDIIRRAYGVTFSRPFWEYRLGSMAIIIGSVVIALSAFTLSIFLSGIQQFVVTIFPAAERVIDLFTLFQILPALMLFGSLYLVFVSLTPKRYRSSSCHKWPGALFTTLWWLATTALLPIFLADLGSYDLTYGSLAGVMIALIFFFVIGLGLVIGAHLNAALAETPEPTTEELVKAKAEVGAA